MLGKAATGDAFQQAYSVIRFSCFYFSLSSPSVPHYEKDYFPPVKNDGFITAVNRDHNGNWLG